jgi:hypothetical protein
MRRFFLSGTAAVMATAAFAAPANAGILTAAAPSCDYPDPGQPFARWGDNANYFLTTGGHFEGVLEGWTLRGGARVVAGNEPWRVRNGSDRRSLHLPAGSRATTPSACVGLEEPAFRFFAKKKTGLLSSLVVDVQVETSLGLVVNVPLGVVLGNGTWKPSPKFLVVANLLPLLPGDKTPVRFSFTPVLGDWGIDDVYVDPWRIR